VRKLVLLATIVSVFAVRGMLLAEEAVKKEAASTPSTAQEVKKGKEVVFDGDKLGENAKGWAAPGSGKATVAAQDKEVRTAGKKTVEFHAEGSQWMGVGWNWFGWYPEDSGTDISAYGSLSFWAKLSGDKKPTATTAQPTVTLVANDKDKKNSQAANLFTYCPTWPTASGTRSSSRSRIWTARTS